MTAWRERHPPEAIDAIVTSTIAAMRGKLGVKKIGAVGYWYAALLLVWVFSADITFVQFRREIRR